MRALRSANVIRASLAAAALVAPTSVMAQALSCAIPAAIPVPHADVPTPQNPQRLLPTGGYTLAITWVPEYCQGHKGDATSAMECGGGNRFGFALHGLWPDGTGKDWPQYCHSTGVLSPATIQRNLCSTPSAQLLQHEWAKHGTCMGNDPDAYFARSTGMYAKLHFPDMTALSRTRPTAGAVVQAIAAANPGLGANMMRVTANKNNWLEEVWLCLDKRFAYTRCGPQAGGVSTTLPVKIWRGEGGGRSRPRQGTTG